jgi:purine nucleosidase
MVKVLLDTDIGSDIDDAVALAYLLAQPDCDLVGVTTVSGDTAQRAACAEALCRAADRTVPIHQGLTGPLVTGLGQPEVPQYAAISKVHPARPSAPDAVEFMRGVIRRDPGEVVLLSIGPLTNVGTLFAVDPEIPSLLGGFTSMAGVYFDSERENGEWNVMVDPVAAAMAYRHAPSGHRCVGLDVTLQVRMDRSEVEERFSTTPVLRMVLEMAAVWFELRKAMSIDEAITFHDPLAAASIFESGLCTFEQGRVRVEYGAEIPPAGNTSFTPTSDGRHHVATSVDVERFFDNYLTTTAGAAS